MAVPDLVMLAVPDLVKLVEWATVVVTFLMIASGMPVCINMYKQRSTRNVPYTLFLISAFVSMLSLQYGILVHNNVLILINAVAVLVWGIYVSVYILISKPKSRAVMKMVSTVVMYWFHITYLKTLPPTHIIDTLGGYLIVWCTILYLIPGKDILTMAKEKSADCCDLPLLCGGTLSAATWCYYGVLVQDMNIYLPCIPAMIVSGIKFFLVFMYGSSDKTVSTPPPRAEVSTDFHKEVYNVSPRQGLRKRM